MKKSKFPPELMKRPSTLRERLIKPCSDVPVYSSKRARFPPSKRINKDQIDTFTIFY